MTSHFRLTAWLLMAFASTIAAQTDAQPQWHLHVARTSQQVNGKAMVCDCTHYCYSPGFWGAHMHDMVSVLGKALALGLHT